MVVLELDWLPPLVDLLLWPVQDFQVPGLESKFGYARN
jgi:hypothetical protein